MTRARRPPAPRTRTRAVTVMHVDALGTAGPAHADPSADAPDVTPFGTLWPDLRRLSA